MRVSVGILPPKKIFNKILKIEKEIAEKYKTYSNLRTKLGPHITITYQPNVNRKDFKKVERFVNGISKKTKSFKIKIKGVDIFPKNRVIYLKVLKSKELDKLFKELSNNLKQFGKIRSHEMFTPHITLVKKDVTKENFKKSFKEFKNKGFSYGFNIDNLYLGKAKPTERIRVVKSFKLK